jgi:alpha-L-rhamnosidase
VTASPLLPTGLRCAHLVNPLGVAPDRVRLSWRLEGSGRDRAQTAYQLEVTAVDPHQTHGQDTVWDSGRVEDTVSTDIEYAGRPLARGTRYSWRVRPGSRWNWTPAPAGTETGSAWAG